MELVALENKEADTVAEALFEKWFCRYGIPLDIVTNRGKEFCAELSEALFKKLGTSHLKTAPYHPKCNSQAEVANKTIQKYLNSFVSDSTLDWELYLAPLMFSYNTSFHRSILNTPHALTFGQQARQPIFIQDDLKRKFYGENSVDEKLQRLQLARKIAQQNAEVSADQAKFYHDKQAQPHNFQQRQWILLREHQQLGKNTKLAPKYSGPYRIVRLKGPHNLEIRLKDGRKTRIVSAEQCKAYFEPMLRPSDEIREPTKNPVPATKLPTDSPQTPDYHQQPHNNSPETIQPNLIMPDILRRPFPKEQPSRTIEIPDNWSTKTQASSQGSTSSSLPSLPSSPFLPYSDQPVFANLPGPSSNRGRGVSESSQTSGSTMTAHYDAEYPEEFSLAIREIQAEEKEGWSFITRRLKQRARINSIKWSKAS